MSDEKIYNAMSVLMNKKEWYHTLEYISEENIVVEKSDRD
jgi:hypothetical protein